MMAPANDITPPGVDPREALLAECAGMLRREIDVYFEGAAVWEHAGDARRQCPRPGSLAPEELELVQPAMMLLRRIEWTIGRPDDAGPWWLNAILDGRRDP